MSCFGISMALRCKVSLSAYLYYSKHRLIDVFTPGGEGNDQGQQTYSRHNSKDARNPEFLFEIGRTETPKVAPSLATPAANPPVVPRNCVGDNIGTSVTVVELGPAFISHTCKTNGLHSNA